MEGEHSVLCDAQHMENALTNLLDNAVKYTPEGGRVGVGLRFGDERVWISVSDTGIGIPSADLDRIFERFYRVDKGRSRAMGGTGLGLAIVRHVVEAHGEKVSVESEVGQGTTFSLSLSNS
jgi:two-component system phosphate regulon sensor histidine kinase PhoR